MRQKKRGQKASKNRRELETKEERIEGTQDMRCRISEETSYEILNNLNFEEVHTDSQ